MTKVLYALYDGKVLRPEEHVALAPNTRVRVTIEALEGPPDADVSFLKTARALELEGPPDWAAHLDAYLYGGDDADA